MDHQEMSSVLAQPSDMISNLPENAIETILMYLPTRDAVRTSILARRWRYRWTKLPELVIDEMLWTELILKDSARITAAMMLYQIMLLHEGPIKKFTLSIPSLKCSPQIDHLILFLSRNNIEDLTFEMWTDGDEDEDDCYRLPSSFFTCQQLRHLSLRCCLIGTTPDFKGFKRLITLKLMKVTISAEVLGSLISSSPLLELLEMEICSDIYDLQIDAPNLKTFIFSGDMKSIVFKNVPLLSSVSIQPYAAVDKTNFREGGICNLVKFFHGLPALENLELGNYLVESLSAGEVPTRLPTTLVYLKDVKLSGLKLDLMDGASFILCLIRSSPNLKHLCIYFSSITTSNTNAVLEFLEEQDYLDIMLNELKEVKLQWFNGARPELELVKLLLAKSPSLKKMLIHPRASIAADKGYKILKELTKFQRASKVAEVVYADGKENQV